MKWIRVLISAIFCPLFIFSQTKENDSVSKKNVRAGSEWTFYGELDYYLIPAGADILSGIATADKGLLHLETRYNYESTQTASVFGGLNFYAGNNLKLVLTPIAGLAFGHLNGFVAGLETNFSYKILDLNSQSEWVLDFAGQKDNFLYTYLELGATVQKNLELGFTAQRTKLYETSVDLQRGIFGQYSFGELNAEISWFNPLTSDYFLILTVDITF